jgi:hypothetical protein
VIACPVCRAENAERTCRRCRADLGLLFDVEAQRLAAEAAARRRAVAGLLAGDFAAALGEWRQVFQLADSNRPRTPTSSTVRNRNAI